MNYSMTQEQYDNKKTRATILKRIHRQADKELKGTDKPLSRTTELLGLLINEKRNSRHLSLLQLSRLTGVAKDTIINIEKGRSNVGILTLDKISSALEMDLRFELVKKKANERGS